MVRRASAVAVVLSLLLLGARGSAHAQSCTVVEQNEGTSVTSLTFPSFTPTAGDLLVVFGYGSSNVQFPSGVSDTVNTWAEVPSVFPSQASGSGWTDFWYAMNVSGTAVSVKVSFTGTATAAGVQLLDCTGMATTNAVDTENAHIVSSATGQSGTINTTNANDVLIGLCGNPSNFATSVSDYGTSGGTFTSFANYGSVISKFQSSASQSVSATGNYGFQANFPGTQADNCGIVAFKDAVAATPTPTATATATATPTATPTATTTPTPTAVGTPCPQYLLQRGKQADYQNVNLQAQATLPCANFTDRKPNPFMTPQAVAGQ